MLHVLNGDATFAALKPLRLDGRALVWRDATLEGPVPHGLETEADWRERARGLAAGSGISERDHAAGALAFLRDLDAAREDETVLWFEEDLFCQLPLCYLLSRKPAGAKWSVICPEEKLGASPIDVLARRFDERRAADAPLVDLATRAWGAYAASDPAALVELLDADFRAWPLLRRGLLLHLSRFPSVKNGLGAAEQTALDDLAANGGAAGFREMFARLGRTPLFQDQGAGDHGLALDLWRLSTGAESLVTIEGASSDELRPGTIESCPRWRVAIARAGEEVRTGARDRMRIAPPDVWLGGVRVRAGAPWRWDAAGARVVRV